MGFFRQEYWSGLPSSRGSSQSGIEPSSFSSPALAGGFFTTSTTWEVLHKTEDQATGKKMKSLNRVPLFETPWTVA